MFPSFENISDTFNDIKTKHEYTLTNIEYRLDKLVVSTKNDIKENVNAMKKDIVVEIKQEVKEGINTIVDERNKE